MVCVSPFLFDQVFFTGFLNFFPSLANHGARIDSGRSCNLEGKE